MKIFTFLIAGSLLFSGCNSNGQQKKNRPITANGLPSVTKSRGQVIRTVPEKHYDGLQPGAIAPDAVIIDADRIVYIINGAFVVEKGNQTALFDITGKMLVPWGRYSFEHFPPDIPSVAMFKAMDSQSNLSGYFNSDGQPGVDFAFESLSSFSNFKVAQASLPRKPGNSSSVYGVIDQSGNFHATNPKEHEFSFRLNANGTVHAIPYKECRYQNYMLVADTFFNKAGKPTIKKLYSKAHNFSEGLAAISQTDQFGEVKWGYMDTTGKVVIPFTYTNEPHDFHNNRALVIPKRPAKFDYAFIDRTGKIAFTVGDGNYVSRQQSDFLNGYQVFRPSLGEDQLIDTNNIPHKISEIMQDKSIKQETSGFTVYEANELGFILRNAKYIRVNNIGMIDAKGKLLFPFAFCDLKPDYYSSYAYAVHSNDLYKNDVTAGIINSQGVFVVAIKKPSTF